MTITVTDPAGTFEPEEREVCLDCGKRPAQPGHNLCPLCEELMSIESLS